MKEKVFKDPVHDHIYVYDPLILKLIDSYEMQRLRRIKQLGLSYLTYHGAEHSRFTHSLGSYEIMRLVLGRLEKKNELFLNEREQLLAKAAALLHDIGHGPFSHSLEELFELGHEEWGKKIILGDSQVNQILKEQDKNFPSDIAQIIMGEYKNELINDLISSQIDVDRMDYLLRDSKITGVNYGEFDLERIIRVMTVNEEGLIFAKNGMHSVESYILARYAMYWQVYFHTTTRSAEIVLKKLFKRAKDLFKAGEKLYLPPVVKNLFSGDLTMKSYLKFDEPLIFSLFSQWQNHSDLILSDLSNRILSRRLFKTNNHKLSNEKIERLKFLFKKAEINPRYYLEVDIPSDVPYDYYRPETSDKKAIYLQTAQGEKLELSQVSQLVNSIAGKKKVRRNLYFPRNFILDKQGQVYQEIRALLLK